MEDWKGNSKSIYVTMGASNHSLKERQNEDYYATDPKALEIFLDKIKKDGIELHKKIWECACGEGHLSKVLETRGVNVWSTDLINRGYGEGNVNFLTCLPAGKWNGDILTNPPYKYAKEFVEKALEITEDSCYTIMFLKIQFLEGQARLKLFKKYPPKYVYVNSARQLCAMNGEFEKYTATAVCYCWYIWQKGFTGEPTVRWI